MLHATRALGSFRPFSRTLQGTRMVCSAQQQQQEGTGASGPSPSRPPVARPPPGRPPMARPPPGRPMPGQMLGPDGQPLEVVPVEKAGPEAWAGVANIDDGKEYNWSKTGVMVAGDMAALLAFAAIGRINHGGVLDLETLTTALPFMGGWLVSASLLGGYGDVAQGSKVGPAAAVAAKCWALGVPLGLVLRGLSKGYVPPTPFIIVSLVSTAVLLVGWRSALAATTKEAAPMTAAAQVASRKDKTGNPFEFLQLLMSLTSRW